MIEFMSGVGIGALISFVTFLVLFILVLLGDLFVNG